MKLISPSSFSGPRAYIVDFDPQKTRYIRNTETWSTALTRRLKVLLLTKKVIVCAGSHLNSQHVFRFLSNNPFLLTEGLVVPALRSDTTQVEDYITARGRMGKEMREFYRENISVVASWHHKPASDDFKNGIIRALRDSGSILRRKLADSQQQAFLDLSDRLQDTDLLSRRDLRGSLQVFDRQTRRMITRFGNLVYYVSGARAVNCETALSSIDYIDFSIGDVLQRKTNLTEEEVFWKYFIELVYHSLGVPPIPQESIDALSFEEIARLRAPLQQAGFYEEYDRILRKALDRVNVTTRESLVTSAQDVLEIRDSIAATYGECIESQKQAFFESRQGRHRAKCVVSLMSFGLGLASLIPVVGCPFGIAATATAGRELYMNVLQRRSFENKPSRLETAIRKIIEQASFSDKHLLYDMVVFLGEVVSTHYVL